ncbi:MAG: helix-turn-helix domain-containing protein [Candidatus Heimdallarchaeota archaeon]
MMPEEFDKLLTACESVTLDFKETYLSDQGKLGKKEKKELVKDLACFANTNGGTILIGVREDPREVIGTDPKILNEEKIQQIIASHSNPLIPNVWYEIFPHPQGAGSYFRLKKVP